jgi:hypothetical protein
MRAVLKGSWRKCPKWENPIVVEVSYLKKPILNSWKVSLLVKFRHLYLNLKVYKRRNILRYKVFLSRHEDGFRCICIRMIHDPEVAPVAFIVKFTIQMLKIPYQWLSFFHSKRENSRSVGGFHWIDKRTHTVWMPTCGTTVKSNLVEYQERKKGGRGRRRKINKIDNSFLLHSLDFIVFICLHWNSLVEFASEWKLKALGG